MLNNLIKHFKLGFNQAEEFTNNWWDELYDSTAKAIEEDRPELAPKVNN